MSREKLDQRGPGHAALGIVKHAVHARKQFQAVETARSSGERIGKRKRLQPKGGQHLTAAMDRNFDPVGKSVEGNVDAFAVTAELRNGFAANVPRGPGKLRSRLGLKSSVDRLKFHCAAK